MGIKHCAISGLSMFSTVCYIYVVWKLPQAKVLKRSALIIDKYSFKFCEKNLLKLNVIEQRARLR